MQRIQPPSRIVAACIAAFLSTQAAKAAVTTWNATGGNWSVGGNWDTLAAPADADDVRFLNTGAGTPTTMDISRTIDSLVFGQDNQQLHTTTINPGQTLSVSRVGAGDVLYVGSTSAAITSSTVTPVAIAGTGAVLSLSGTGDLVVRQGNSSAGAHMATLDLSGLDTFNATVGRLLVGQANAGNAVNRPSGTLILAKTNYITLTGASPQVMLQDSGSNANGGTPSVLQFGQETHLFGGVMRLAGQKGNGNLNFNPAFSLPSLQIRNADGVSRSSIIDFGYNGATSSGNSTICVADFSTGTVDILADLVNIAQGNPGPSLGACTATLTIGAGVFDVNNLDIGHGNATGASGATTGTFNVDNSSLFSTGAKLIVNETLRLARTNGGTGVVTGNLNLNGGVVAANSIVSGGGVSTISVNFGSTLIVSNTAGTLVAPIGTLNLSDATLNIPASNGGAAVAVKTLNASGSQNRIDISAIPPVVAYPATFTLINYQTGASGNFVLGSLPPASPSYSGSLVDTGNGVVQLQLTAGPVSDLSLVWQGTLSSDWDSFTYNWLSHGVSTNFFAGAVATFDDTALLSTINLAEPVTPGLMAVSNVSLPYTFSGIGNISAGLLTKKGSGSLTLDNTGIDTFVNVGIDVGTLQIGSGGTDGNISAINITNNAALIVNRSGTIALSSAIVGTGTLTKTGNGTLTLSGINNYSGTTTLSQGSLVVDGTQGAGTLTTAAGTVLAGSGTVNGLITVGGQLNPGLLNGPGTFKAYGGLTLASGGTVRFDLSATDPSNPAVNDSVDVQGNLTLNNNTITVNIAGAPANGSSYLLFTYSGSLSGSFNPVVLGTHFPVTIDTSIPGAVYLTITGDAGLALRWNSFGDPAWDSVATNWQNILTSADAVFGSGDSVLLDDTVGVVTGITIDSGVNAYPAAITNNSTNNYFTITGAGKISGNTTLVKAGPSTLVLGTANNFTGTVDIEGGTLQTDNDAALGTAAAGTTVHDGATLNLNGRNLGGEVITASGSGPNGEGAIVNNGSAQFQAVRQIVLAGDTTFGGTGTWQMNNGGGGASLSTGGNPFNLTKVGPNQIGLAQVASIDAALGNIDIQQGTLEFSGLTTSMGNPTATNSVQAGATLSFANGTVAWNKQFVFNGDGTTTTVNNGTGANAELAGPVELHGDCVFNVGGTLMTISGLISGDGGLIKNGGSPLILSTDNTYTGDTRINTAALRLSGEGSIAGSSNVIINAGATLTVTGRVDTAFTLTTGHTLKGNGTINGKLIANAGSIVSPGIDAIGTLTISNAVTLAGTNIMELDPVNATNDLIRSSSTITYGGTLNLVNLGPLDGGSSFKLFNATSYIGSFASINPPTPGPGQTWDLTALGTSGTIKVSSAASPVFSSIVLSGGNLVISGSNGVASGSYYVLTSTNVALPLASWTPIATNAFNGSGNFSFTNAIDPSQRQLFYQIQLP